MVRDYIKRRSGFLLFLSLIILSRIFLWGIVSVSGDSMAPSFEDKQRLLAVNYSRISRFDVVTINSSSGKKDIYLKRVIGLPGETIEMKEDVLHVNGEIVNEPFLLTYRLEFYRDRLQEIYQENAQHQKIAAASSNFTGDFSVVVPAGHYFLLGDNRLLSMDSRSEEIGMVNKSDIRNEVKMTFWPLTNIKFHL